MFLGITPVSSVSNGLYFLTLPLVSVMHIIYNQKECRKSLGCALYIRCALSIEKYGIMGDEGPVGMMSSHPLAAQEKSSRL
jgi:hypothetical protein